MPWNHRPSLRSLGWSTLGLIAVIGVISLAVFHPWTWDRDNENESESVAPGRLPSVDPAEAGMSVDRLDAIDRLINKTIKAGGFAGAAIVIGREGDVVFGRGYGRSDWAASSPPISIDSTIYDLASLTKVVGTTSAIMFLVEDGVLHLDDPVRKWIPTFTGGAKDSVTIRQLLTHHSGLPPGRKLTKFMGNPAAARAAVIGTKLDCPPGKCYEYSDLGADMLAFIAEAAAHEPIDKFLQRRLFDPLGMSQTFYRPPRDVWPRIAPTGAPPGRVHDGNAAALGGVAGHAGLFSTAGDLAVFAQLMLNHGEYEGRRIFEQKTVDLFTHREAGTRALGWDTCDSTSNGSCGKYMSRTAFGHTGFTGTSMWIDPDHHMFMILLTNRVNDTRVKRPRVMIQDVRADIADAALLALQDAPTGELPMPRAFRSDVQAKWQQPIQRKRVRAKRSVRGRKKTVKKPVKRSAKKTAKRPVSGATRSRPSR